MLQCLFADFVLRQLNRVRVFERPHRVEHRARDLVGVGRATEQCVKRGRRRNRFTHRLCPGGKNRERRLVIVDEDGAVLQQRAIVPPLGAADQLASVRHQLSFARRLEAASHAWRTCG